MNKMRCTASMTEKDDSEFKKDRRCERELGHGGLHFWIKGMVIQEFSDLSCWFPWFKIDGEIPERIL